MRGQIYQQPGPSRGPLGPSPCHCALPHVMATPSVTSAAPPAESAAHAAPPGPLAWPAERFMGRASALKLGMWIFLLSDAFSFAGLLISYGVLRAASGQWWP